MKKKPTKIAAIGADQSPPVFNEEGNIVAGPLPDPGPVDASEDRLPESTQVSWMMSAKAWRDFMGRFRTSAG